MSNLFGLGFVYLHGPVVAYLLSFAVSPGGMGYLILLVEERRLRPSEQWTSFIWGNSAGLSIVVGATDVMAPGLPPGMHHWWMSQTWQIACFTVAAAIGPVHGFVEYRFLRAYTRTQMASPAKAYHNTLVYAVLAFWIFSATIPSVACSSSGFGGDHWPGWQIILVLGALVFFVAMLAYDANPAHAKRHAHVAFSWKRFLRGQPQTYEEVIAWKFRDWFPPRVAFIVLLTMFIFGYLQLRS